MNKLYFMRGDRQTDRDRQRRRDRQKDRDSDRQRDRDRDRERLIYHQIKEDSALGGAERQIRVRRIIYQFMTRCRHHRVTWEAKGERIFL